MGYAGSPPGMNHCLDVGCDIHDDKPGCQATQHAEVNAIAWAARAGVGVDGAELFVTISPCLACAKAIITAGIKKVTYLEAYRDTAGIDYLMKAGVQCENRTVRA